VHAAPNIMSKVMIHVPSKCLSHSRHHQLTLKRVCKYIQKLTSLQSEVDSRIFFKMHVQLEYPFQKKFPLGCSSGHFYEVILNVYLVLVHSNKTIVLLG